jgi:DNA-binding transcriptional LysR family regulator
MAAPTAGAGITPAAPAARVGPAPAPQTPPAVASQVIASQDVTSAPGFDGLHVMPGIPAYAATPLGRLHYWSLGTGPAIVLLHQGPLFAIEFAKVMPLLAARGFRAIAVDIPGFDFSQRPDHPATGELAAMRSGRLGTVRLGFGPGIASDAMLGTLARCAQDRADVVVSLHIGYPDTVFGMLRRGELDALVTLRPPASLDPDLRFEPLATVTSVVVARAAHPFAREPRRRTFAELAGAAWAVYSQRGFEDFWRVTLRLEDRALPMLRLRCNTPTVIKQVILEGDYLALLSRDIVEPELRRGEIVEIDSDLAPLVTQACIVIRKGSVGTAALALVLGELRRLGAARPRGGEPGRTGRGIRKTHGRMNSRQ